MTIEHLFERANTRALEKFGEEKLPDILAAALQKQLKSKTIQKDDLITRAQVSKELQCSLSHTDKLIRSGLLPAFRIGSMIRIKRSDFQASLQLIKTFKYSRDRDAQ